MTVKSWLKPYFAILLTILLYKMCLLKYSELIIINANQKLLRKSESGCISFHGVCLPQDAVNDYERQRLPTALIIGIRKGGTRGLLMMLGAHPLIEATWNEPHFFDNDEHYRLGYNWYRSQMPLSNDGQICIEKTPSYLLVDTVPERVFTFNSKIKLLAILRNPITRLLSDHAQIARKREILEAKPLPLPGKMYINNQTGQVHEKIDALKVGAYVLHFERWLRYFNREQLLILDGDQFVKDPLPELKKAETFLGLTPYFTEENVYFNESKGFYCWLVEGFPQCLGDNKGRPHSKISRQERDIFNSYYKPYNFQLFKLINQTFDWS